MATINTTTEFVPEIWEQIKAYAGIFPVLANIIHFDKLTSAELEESIDGYEDEVPRPFGIIRINSVYEILEQEHLDYSGGKWFYDGGEIKEDEKKKLLVKHIKNEYNSCFAPIRQKDKIEFWNEVSEMITYHFQNRDKKKAEAKKKRAAAKAIKETPKGMIAEINKIEDERRRLMKRIKNDQEKLNKLTTKGRGWRTKLAEKDRK
mgnify:CR=1 FL=1